MATRLRGAIERGRQRRRTQRQLTSQQEAIRQADQSLYQSPHINPYQDTSRDNYRTYPYDYYSGTDCKVFYGDIWVDDIVSIQYTVNQSKTPIYGYAAQNYNAVAKGRVLVNGMLTIAFKETGYLNLIQRVAETQKNNAYKVIKRKVDVLQAKSEHRLAKFDPSLTYIGDQAPPGSTINTKINPNGSPQLIRQQETIEEILLGMKAGNALVKTFESDSVTLGEKNRDFEDFAELMEDSIWGDSNGRPYGITNLLKRADEFDYNTRGGINVGRGQGKNAEYDKVLNIMLTFGDINDFRAEHTLVLLNDVHFTDTSMIVSPDGTPIAESYAFFARDINRSISNEILQNINPIKLEVGVDDIELAKLEDIEAVEQKLNQAGSNEPWVVGIKPIAALNEFGWRSVELEEIEVYLSMNRGIPLVDRVIEAAQKGFNDVQFADIVELDKTQYIADVFLGLNSTLGESFTMVFEQSIPNTRTYRVIAPVRTGFRAPVIYTREDFFTDVGALPEPLEEVGGILDRNKQTIAAREAELAQDRENLNQERLSLGLQDETEEFQRRQADTARRQEQLADADTALGRAIRERQLNRAIRRESEAASELGQERARSLGERDLTRTERDRLHDLTNSYNANAAEAQELIEDSETFNSSYSTYTTKKVAELDDQIEAVENQSEAIREQIRIEQIIQQEVSRQVAEYEKNLPAARERAKQEYAEQQQKSVEEYNKAEREKLNRTGSETEQSSTWPTQEVQDYNSRRITTAGSETGVAVTSSSASHMQARWIHKFREYSDEQGGTLAADVGNIGRAGTIGTAPAAFGGEVTGIGTTSFTVKTEDGKLVTYEEVDTGYISSLRRGERIVTAQTNIPFQRDHYQVTVSADDFRPYELDSTIMSNLGVGYRGTIPTIGPTTEAPPDPGRRGYTTWGAQTSADFYKKDITRFNAPETQIESNPPLPRREFTIRVDENGNPIGVNIP